jgi:hypothetical protein
MTRRRLCVGILLIGVCALAGFGTVAAVKAASLGSGSPRHVPGQFRESLSAGRWDIYELTGTTTGSSVGPLSYSVTHRRSRVLDASVISVTAPDGQPVSMLDQATNVTETIQKGSDLYTGVANFDAPRSGSYSITVNRNGPGQVILARPVLSELAGLLPWAGGALGGAACIALGLILLTLGYRRPAQPPDPAPAAGQRTG